MLYFYIHMLSVVLLTLLYWSSAAIYILKKDWVRQSLEELNFPAPWLVPFMVVIKIFGPLAIIFKFSISLSIMAYAGIFYHLLISALAHICVKNNAKVLPAVAGLALLVCAFVTQNSIH